MFHTKNTLNVSMSLINVVNLMLYLSVAALTSMIPARGAWMSCSWISGSLQGSVVLPLFGAFNSKGKYSGVKNLSSSLKSHAV